MVRFEMREGGLGPKRKRVTWPWLMVWSSPFPSVHHWSLITQKKKKKNTKLILKFQTNPTHSPIPFFSPFIFLISISLSLSFVCFCLWLWVTNLTLAFCLSNPQHFPPLSLSPSFNFFSSFEIRVFRLSLSIET